MKDTEPQTERDWPALARIECAVLLGLELLLVMVWFSRATDPIQVVWVFAPVFALPVALCSVAIWQRSRAAGVVLSVVAGALIATLAREPMREGMLLFLLFYSLLMFGPALCLAVAVWLVRGSQKASMVVSWLLILTIGVCVLTILGELQRQRIAWTAGAQFQLTMCVPAAFMCVLWRLAYWTHTRLTRRPGPASA